MEIFLAVLVFKLLEDIAIVLGQWMRFGHEGAPSDFSVTTSAFLNEQYVNKWIERRAHNSVNLDRIDRHT